MPVIILSSLVTDRDIEQGFTVGAAAYISKSEAQSQLIETIEKFLEKSRFHRSRLILVVDDSQNIRQGEKPGCYALRALKAKKSMFREAFFNPIPSH